MRFGWLLLLALMLAGPAWADEDARTKQLRLLCAQLSGDLTEPGGIAAFKRCLTQNPVDAMEQNAFPGAAAGPKPAAPAGFGQNTRQNVAGAVVDFQIVDGKLVYALITDRKLWRSTLGSGTGDVLDSEVAGFHALDATLVYVQGTDGKLWREAGDARNRVLVDAEVAAFQPLDASSVYVRNRDGTLWREAGDQRDRQLVDREVAEFQALDARIVYVLGRDGKLWREAGDAQTRLFVAEKISRFHVVGDTVYVLTGDQLWRQTKNDPPARVADAVVAFQPLGPELVYLRDGAGRLWREHGTEAKRELVDDSLASQPEPAGFQAIDATQVYVLDRNHGLWSEKMPPGATAGR